MTLTDTIERRSATRRETTRRKYLADIPMLPDPDVLNLIHEYRICYSWARILKCLSFGIRVDTSLLAWAGGYDDSPRAFENALMQIKRRVPWCEIRFMDSNPTCRQRQGYQITDSRVLARIRADMRGEA
jgi:hypothetical protein